MTTSRMLVLAALTRRRLATLLRSLPPEPRRGRPWSRSRRHRVLIACAALRTNLTIRELAASFAITKSAAHRIVQAMIPLLAGLARDTRLHDRRESWVVDGTLIPMRDHRRAARSKNYWWSCNAQVLIRRRDLTVVATAAGGPGNRNDTIHYRGSAIEASLPTVATVASRSSSPRCFAATGSCATEPGDDIVAGVPGSNTRSLASRTGVSSAIIAAAAVTSRTPSGPSSFFTTSTLRSYGTTLSPA